MRKIDSVQYSFAGFALMLSVNGNDLDEASSGTFVSSHPDAKKTNASRCESG